MDYFQTETSHITHDEKQIEIRKSKQKRMKNIMITLAGTSLFFFLTTVYLQYQVYILEKLDKANELMHPEVPTTPDQIVEAVSHHILLPDTLPQIAVIQDAKKLSTAKDFFKDAVNGDVMLAYETMIIVYRPTQDLIIAVGTIESAQK
jgi:hypothetical protein